MAPNRFFAAHPQRDAALASGTATRAPFYCVDGDALLLLGDLDLAAARRLLEEEGLHPVETPGGAAGALWLMDYRDTTAGAYTEVVLTLAAAARPRRERGRSAATHAALVLDPDVLTFCHRLLLPARADLAIRYGRDLLNLDKDAVEVLDVRHVEGRRRVEVADGGRPMLRADVRESTTAVEMLGAALGLVRAVKPTRLARALTGAGLSVVAPARMGGGTIRSFLRGMATLHPWGGDDRLELHGDHPFIADLRALDLRPRMVQRVPHAQFVMYPVAAAHQAAPARAAV